MKAIYALKREIKAIGTNQMYQIGHLCIAIKNQVDQT